MKIGIIGTGVFSTSLALALANNKNNQIVMWSENENLVTEYKKTAKIPTLFQDKMFPKSIKITASYEDVLQNANLVLLVTGVTYLDNVCKDIAPLIEKNIPICIGTKGIVEEGNLFVHEVVRKYLKNPIGILGGPTFALDVANLEPVALNIASHNKMCIKVVKEVFFKTNVFLQPISDILGVALCGCVKNIYAIGAGIIAGLGYKESTFTFYLTEVYKELEIILCKFKSSIENLHSLSGFGDLVLTCSSHKSRNYSFGEIIGHYANEETRKKYLKKNTVEGVQTIKALYPILKKKRINLPILNCIYQIVFENLIPESLITTITKKEN